MDGPSSSLPFAGERRGVGGQNNYCFENVPGGGADGQGAGADCAAGAGQGDCACCGCCCAGCGAARLLAGGRGRRRWPLHPHLGRRARGLVRLRLGFRLAALGFSAAAGCTEAVWLPGWPATGGVVATLIAAPGC